MEPRPCPACPLLPVVSASASDINLRPGQSSAVTARLAAGGQQQQRAAARVRVFGGESPRRRAGGEKLLSLPAADHVEPGATQLVCPVQQDGVFIVDVVNAQRESLLVTTGLRLGFGQPLYIKD